MLPCASGRRGKLALGACSCPFAGMTRIRFKGSPPGLNEAADSQPLPWGSPRARSSVDLIVLKSNSASFLAPLAARLVSGVFARGLTPQGLIAHDREDAAEHDGEGCSGDDSATARYDAVAYGLHQGREYEI